MSKKIDIIIVDDHMIFRDGLKSILSQVEEFRVINEAETGTEFLSLLDRCQPDIVLMDISMPEMDGIEATEKAIQKYPLLKIITLSGYSDHIYYYKMIKAGAQGFVLKQSGKEEITNAINTVYNGENYFPQEILRSMIFKIGHKGIDSAFKDEIAISKREIDVLELICKGFTNNEIAETLHISPKTVDKHRSHLLFKTSTKNSAHLVMFAIKNHIIEI